MRYVYMLLLVGVLSSSKACDVCGVNAATMGIGFITDYNNNYIRLGYSHLSYEGVRIIGVPSIDDFHQYEIQLRYGLSSRWKLSASLPYQMNMRTKGTFSEQQRGIGDMRLITQYAILNNVYIGSKSRLYIEAGVGASIPTGRYERDIDDRGIPENFNTGKGVIGAIGQLNATWKSGNSGLAMTGQYQMNTDDSDGYQFGDQISAGCSLFHQRQSNRLTYTPIIGVSYEHINQDQYDYGGNVRGTGGTGWFLSGGLSMTYDRYQIGGNYMLPIHDDYSSGEVKAKGRWSVQMTYIL